MKETGEPTDGGFGAATLASEQRHREMLARMEQKWRARQIAVPTNDKLVMLRLRELKEPIILFGEAPEDRRERLRDVLARLRSDQAMPSVSTPSAEDESEESSSEEEEEDDEDKDEEGPEKEKKPRFVDTGNEELRKVRTWLVLWSLQRARERVLAQQREREDEHATEAKESAAESLCARAASWANATSQVGDERPLSCCAASADGSAVVTGGWSGVARIWRTSDCEVAQTLRREHAERVLGVAVAPGSTTAKATVASCTADGEVALWSSDRPTPTATFHGHSGRANRVAFHPSGRLLASTGEDRTYRLWDLESGSCLFAQKGHSLPVFGIAFQCDGSLAATCSADAHVRLWDLRLGTCACVLEGHVLGLVTVDWSPNGFVLASGGEDNTVRLWDVRQRKCSASIPAHGNLISAIKFDRERGCVLASGSFDGTARLWKIGRNNKWKPLGGSLSGHEGKIVGIDMTAGPDSMLVTASYDRTWKLWQSPKVSQHPEDAAME